MSTHAFHMTEHQATLIHRQIASHCCALKNWIASAAEQDDLPRAKMLVSELREHEALFAAFNMPAKHEIAKYSDSPLETVTHVRP